MKLPSNEDEFYEMSCKIEPSKRKKRVVKPRLTSMEKKISEPIKSSLTLSETNSIEKKEKDLTPTIQVTTTTTTNVNINKSTSNTSSNGNSSNFLKIEKSKEFKEGILKKRSSSLINTSHFEFNDIIPSKTNKFVHELKKDKRKNSFSFSSFSFRLKKKNKK